MYETTCTSPYSNILTNGTLAINIVASLLLLVSLLHAGNKCSCSQSVSAHETQHDKRIDLFVVRSPLQQILQKPAHNVPA